MYECVPETVAVTLAPADSLSTDSSSEIATKK